MKKALFIDRDGTMIVEPPVDKQVDSLEKLEFVKGVFGGLYKISRLDYELVIVSNQDGLGTDSFPEEDFKAPQEKMLQAFENEDIHFDAILIDNSFPADNAPTRKPRTGLLKSYMNGDYDLASCFVIGDRLTDMGLAKNLGAKGIFFADESMAHELEKEGLSECCALISNDWQKIWRFLAMQERGVSVKRKTSETDIEISLNLDGEGKAEISTGISFFDHMLEQIARHGSCDLFVKTKGDLQVDEHHSIEDTGIALGEAFCKALGNKVGIERYGFCLPMDDCLAQVSIDFGGRNWIVWEADFKREKIGDMPTEMFFHFFKSFSDAARCNLNIKAEGQNEHHKIEGIFKAFARAIAMAKKRDTNSQSIPSTKGSI